MSTFVVIKKSDWITISASTAKSEKDLKSWKAICHAVTEESTTYKMSDDNSDNSISFTEDACEAVAEALSAIPDCRYLAQQIKNAANRHMQSTSLSKKIPIGSINGQYIDEDIEGNYDELGLPIAAPTEPSKFYYKVLAIVNDYQSRLVKESPSLKIELWETRKEEVTLLRETLGKAKENFNDIHLEVVCRKIATQDLDFIFGRTELPKKLAALLFEVDRGKIKINKVGSKDNQELQERLNKLQNKYDQLKVQMESQANRLNQQLEKTTNDLNRNSKIWNEKIKELIEFQENMQNNYEHKLEEFKQEVETVKNTSKQEIEAIKKANELDKKIQEIQTRIKIKEIQRDNAAQLIKTLEMKEPQKAEQDRETWSIAEEGLRKEIEELQVELERLQKEKSDLRTMEKKNGIPISQSSPKKTNKPAVSPASHHQASSFKVEAPDFDDLTNRFERMRQEQQRQQPTVPSSVSRRKSQLFMSVQSSSIQFREEPESTYNRLKIDSENQEDEKSDDDQNYEMRTPKG